MKTYELGNCLRGYFKGDFEEIETAWRVLSHRFLLSFPSQSGRSVEMFVREPNSYSILEFVKCREGVTSLEAASAEEYQHCKCA